MRSEVLEQRLEELGWSPYRAAKEIAKLRGELEQAKRPTRYASAVRQALENPNRSSFETIERLVTALGGQLVIRWEERQQVVTGTREVEID